MINILLLLHFVGWAILLGGLVASLRRHHHFGPMLAGSLTALFSGVALLIASPTNYDYTLGLSPQMITKIVLTVITTGVVIFGYRAVRNSTRNAENSISATNATGSGDAALSAVAPWIKYLIGGLTLATLVVSIFWR